jgi:hypothetical protein
MLLVLVSPVADLAEPMDENCTRKAVAGLALVELLAGLLPEFGIGQPVQGKNCPGQSAQSLQRRSGAVLPRKGGQLAQDHRGRHHAVADGHGDPQDVVPVGPDEPDVDPHGDQRLQRRIGRRLLEAVQAPVLQIGDAGREADAK